MIIRSPESCSLPSTLRQCFYKSYLHHPCRRLHARTSTAQTPIPDPTPFVPDASTFLKLIGRNLSQHASKIPNWQSLFSLTSPQLRELGVEPARTRKYLLWWRDRFRKGVFGIGGDLENVKEGGAELRVVEVPLPGTTIPATGLPRVKKLVVNEPPDLLQRTLSLDMIKPVEGMKVQGARTIVGPYIQPVKGTSGSVATIKVQEGMWEERRGVKVDGGERRKVQVRRKRLLQERRTKRT
ncbi:telomere length regulation protein [Lecanora helva]